MIKLKWKFKSISFWEYTFSIPLTNNLQYLWFFFFQFCSSLRLSKRGSVNYYWLLGKHPRITSLNIKHYSLRKFYSLPPHFQFTSGQSLSYINSLWPHGLQHARLLCPSPTSWACSNSCPLSPGCHPTISSSIVPFSSCLQSRPASGSFPMSQFFTSGGQNIGVSGSASVLQWIFRTDFLWDWLVWSPCSPRDSQESSPVQYKSISSSVLSFLYGLTLTSIHDYWKNNSFD